MLNGLAREFGVFDHWFSEVPSQTFMNRSFWTSATSSGLVVNSPAKKWLAKNDAETIFERLEQHGKSWKIYVAEPMAISFHGLIHYSRLKHGWRRTWCRSPSSSGTRRRERCPTSRSSSRTSSAGTATTTRRSVVRLATTSTPTPWTPPSSVLAGEAFLQRIFDAYRSSTSESGSNVRNTTLLIGWDEPGGTYDHVPPGAVPPPDPDAPVGELGFAFDRSGYRVPAILVSPWIPRGSVFNDEYRHTSLIATLRKVWDLGEAFTQRDAAARTFDDLFTLDEPRDPQTWAKIAALPVPAWQLDEVALNRGLSGLGKTMGQGVLAHARELGVELPARFDHEAGELAPAGILDLLAHVAGHYFPLLAPDAATVAT